VILAQTGNFTREGGKRVMEAFLKSRGDEIDAVYAHNDDMALGAIQALQAAGKKPGQDVLIVSIDGTKAAFEAMVRGELNATVECLPLLGPYAFDAVERILKGGEEAANIPKWIKVKDQIHTQAKAAELLPTRKY
jgi:ABC-type sugar transport system substrate-binding protein